MLYLPFFGAMISAGGTIIAKTILKKKNISPSLFQVTVFLGLTGLMLPLIYFFWRIDLQQALTYKNLLILGLVVIFSIIANVLHLHSLKKEKVGNLVSAGALSPMFVIILAFIFSFFIDSGLYQREANILIPGLIAATAILLSHVEKHHFKFNKYYIYALIAGVFGALELTTSRMILDLYSPITFYFVRVFFILLISLLIFRPDFKKMDKESSYLMILACIIWISYRVIIYSGYTSIGIISTTLIIMLSPTFLYLFTYIFLKEKIKIKNMAASAVVIMCIAYVMLF
jgi:drug/metabolite transporter (DMT)-like permease|tara:strand:+ start:610 stop:1467 length:858 start_codon:yes stop_codon:yes gene_type:complete